MSKEADIKNLLDKLGCKTTSEDIADDARPAIANFLKKELSVRTTYRIGRLFAGCGVNARQMRTFDKFDWLFNPKVPKHAILEFRNSNWIEDGKNLVMIGDAGIGKSHIAKSLCHDAILKEYPAYFGSAFELVSKIKNAANPVKKIDYYGRRIAVLCIDELGYVFHAKEDADLLFQIISKRSEMLPTIVTTNLAPKNWGSILSASAASVILDRLSANGSFLAWTGPSHRMHRKTK